jgi:hypothetical protein
VDVNSKLVGTTFHDRQESVKALNDGQRLYWKHEQDNVFDENAILVFADEQRTREVGHLNRRLAEVFVKRMKRGVEQAITVSKVTGNGPPYGVNVIVHY